RIPVRLVKGAYWDTEIKLAQQKGLSGYPVWTRKEGTDTAYLACARFLLSEQIRGLIWPQFATHNAHTLSSIMTMSAHRDFEFQRLHGMGDALY
ncbi:proline dehydrogenase family protein, partial [Pseudoalteromonas sp. SIMBA_148]